MTDIDQTIERLGAIPNLTLLRDVPLASFTRFAIGGPARILVQTGSVEAFIEALSAARASGLEMVVIGGGTNLIVSDGGFPGIVLKFTGSRIYAAAERVIAEAGAELQALVDFTIHRGLKGLETLSGIPGSVGAAVYGNAGAYGHSISESIRKVRFFDGADVRVFENSECEFRYRESVFKQHKEWIIFSTELVLQPAARDELRRIADDILKVRNEKFPPTMKCAGSIFKNLLHDDLAPSIREQVPASVIREGKVAAAWFLEQVGSKGMQQGDIHVATYHANLIYNSGGGTAKDLCTLIDELKARVQSRFGLELEEEVQYVGFSSRNGHPS